MVEQQVEEGSYKQQSFRRLLIQRMMLFSIRFIMVLHALEELILIL